MGKFGDFTDAPRHPYVADRLSIRRRGDSGLVELPWAVFPLLRTPAGSGITHRVFGTFYNRIATRYSMRHGVTSYYFHPYEIDECAGFRASPATRSRRARFFMRKVGTAYREELWRFVRQHRHCLVNGETVANGCHA